MNELKHETSPYLLQHAQNPVYWKAWNKKSLQTAKDEKKLIIISVGYAACHWCHVMEHESFEDSTVATVMNKSFINIKVDREERPDIDQVYMTAVQLMTGSGGWPMNVVALPDGRPVWGGTYFRKGDWVNALQQIQKIYEKSPEKLIEYAEKLDHGIQQANLIAENPNTIKFEKEALENAVAKWSLKFDRKKGGLDYAPKFMMPNNYHFLLRYAHQTKNDSLLSYTLRTLNKISYGGVYDHIGGGFARYSVDDKWHVPHFEKMLYDNGQLVSLYSDAFLLTSDPWYKQVVFETLDFISREMTTEEGAFYSSLDADSLDDNGHLEEGAYYVWQKPQLKALLKEDYDLFADYYNINSYGIWEHNNYVLIRDLSDEAFIKKHRLELSDFHKKQKQWKILLLKERNKREPPRLDDKTLTSWNALMLKGYVDAYRVFNNKDFLNIAIKNANFIIENQLNKDGRLWHNYKNGKSTANGYLEDYATVIDAFISLYEVTIDEKWLNHSKTMAEYALKYFYDSKTGMFFFTSDEDEALISRSMETSDNVIPASNSIMAKNCFKLSHYFSDSSYLDRSKKMLHTIKPNFTNYPSGHSNWMDLFLNFSENYYEIVVIGEKVQEKMSEIQQKYLPNKLLAGSKKASENPLFKNRFNEKSTLIYVCQNNSCKLPVKEAVEAFKLLK